MSYRLNCIVAVDNLGEPPCCCGLLLWLPVRCAGGVCGGVAAGELATEFVRELEMDGSFEVTLPRAVRGAEFKRGEACVDVGREVGRELRADPVEAGAARRCCCCNARETVFGETTWEVRGDTGLELEAGV